MTITQTIAAHERVKGIPRAALCSCGWESPVRGKQHPREAHADHVVDMLRQARTITTIDQLDALPVETVVRELSRDGFVLEKYWDQVWDEARWLYPGDDDPQPFPSLPALVLWRPEDGAQ